MNSSCGWQGAHACTPACLHQRRGEGQQVAHLRGERHGTLSQLEAFSKQLSAAATAAQVGCPAAATTAQTQTREFSISSPRRPTHRGGHESAVDDAGQGVPQLVLLSLALQEAGAGWREEDMNGVHSRSTCTQQGRCERAMQRRCAGGRGTVQMRTCKGAHGIECCGHSTRLDWHSCKESPDESTLWLACAIAAAAVLPLPLIAPPLPPSARQLAATRLELAHPP